MTTTKRCEVCHKEKCNDWDCKYGEICEEKKSIRCHGRHPRPDDSGKACGVCKGKGVIVDYFPEPPSTTYQERTIKSVAPCPSCPTSKEVLPRTEEWKKHLVERFYKTTLEMPVFDKLTDYVERLLLSYGKERERTMWLKCWEVARNEANSPVQTKDGKKEDYQSLRKRVLDKLDSLNPDNSSPDEGREGRA